jgi:hypothetical protein
VNWATFWELIISHASKQSSVMQWNTTEPCFIFIF